ncbi:MAG TPA: transketolase [Candidatus Saccharimonadales bacterium]|nr:transketolase [Candidatus Saccharimonadales bacterium]
MPETADRTDETIDSLKSRAARLRVESLRATTTAGSGHPTTCMSAADLVSALFFGVMRYDPAWPDHPANDRFVLSKGHAAPLLYAAWAEAGAIARDHLLTLRRYDSELEGHPTARFAWSEAATGSLGQGLSIGLGIALAAKYLERSPYRTFVLLGDGECAEGSVWEAANLASHYKLDNLVAIVDVNRLGQSQATMFGHDVEAYVRRFEAFGWKAIAVDGHDMEKVLAALRSAAAGDSSGRPTAVVARTFKGRGVSFLEDKDGWHGKPVPAADLEKALKELPSTASIRPFKPVIPPEITVSLSKRRGEIEPPAYTRGDEVATRSAYGTALVKLGKVDPSVVALDGDTKNSTHSLEFMKAYPDRFFEGFIAEQNIAGAAVGLARRGFNPFVSAFACFLTRSYDFIRMAPIGRAKIRFCGSHCGVSIGADGPSQMGLEDLAMMRTVAGSIVLYPSDAVSTERLVAAASTHDGVAYIRTSRPKTPVLYENGTLFPVGGSKAIRASGADQITLVGAGITLHESIKAAEILRSEGVQARVVDAYSVKPVDAEGLAKQAADTGSRMVVTEDHYEAGGLGEAIAAALAGRGVRLTRLAVREVPRSGEPEELIEGCGISGKAIAAAAREALKD